MGVPEGTFYSWKQRYGKVNEHNGWIPRDHWLEDWEKRAILSFYWEHPLDGYRRLTYMMLDANVVAVSASSVYRVLKQAGVLDRHNTKATRKGKGFQQPNRPHRDWHVDIAYLNVGGTFYYLCSILDGYSRFIVHWEIREAMTEQDVETIIQRGREKFPGETPRIISDNGPQFIAKDFKAFIRICGMTHVRTSPYYLQSNGKLERYHRTIKGECIRPGTPLCLEDARRLVAKYVAEYNGVRLHSALGYVTPADKLFGREEAIFTERDRKLQEAREKRAANRRRSKALDCREGCYTEDAWAEDRATVRTDPSADPGPGAKVGPAACDSKQPSAPPHFLSIPTSLLAQCDKPNPENTAFSPLNP
jgi:transposase InsO family protein